MFSRYSISLIGSSESNFQLLLHTTTAFSKSFMVPFPNMTISLIRSNILAKKKAPKTELAGILTNSILYSVFFKIICVLFILLKYIDLYLLTWCVIFRIWYLAIDIKLNIIIKLNNICKVRLPYQKTFQRTIGSIYTLYVPLNLSELYFKAAGTFLQGLICIYISLNDLG